MLARSRQRAVRPGVADLLPERDDAQSLVAERATAGKTVAAKMRREFPVLLRWIVIAERHRHVCASISALAQQSPAAQRGLTFVRVHCAQCHAISKVGDSELTIAPPFRTLHLKYPIENLQRPLSEGIIAGHPTMPQFRLDADQVGDVIAYLKTLEQ